MNLFMSTCNIFIWIRKSFCNSVTIRSSNFPVGFLLVYAVFHLWPGPRWVASIGNPILIATCVTALGTLTGGTLTFPRSVPSKHSKNLTSNTRVNMLARIRELYARITHLFHAQFLQIVPISRRFAAYSRAYRESGPWLTRSGKLN